MEKINDLRNSAKYTNDKVQEVFEGHDELKDKGWCMEEWNNPRTSKIVMTDTVHRQSWKFRQRGAPRR
jgi:hypothetical protein